MSYVGTRFLDLAC